ncbi:hypothetical protein FRC07_003721 [Ceratobasidium sp. 392]|nr:hypothetical protein FRC07_003721 [Ceratobasidium sp. 392]
MSNNQAHVGTSALPYIVAKFEGHAIAIKRDADYQAILKALQQYIPKLRSVGTHNIFISATLAEYGDTLVQISGEIWPELVNTLNSIEITTTDPANTGPAMASAVGRQSVDVAALPGEGTVTTVTNWPQVAANTKDDL